MHTNTHTHTHTHTHIRTRIHKTHTESVMVCILGRKYGACIPIHTHTHTPTHTHSYTHAQDAYRVCNGLHFGTQIWRMHNNSHTHTHTHIQEAYRICNGLHFGTQIWRDIPTAAHKHYCLTRTPYWWARTETYACMHVCMYLRRYVCSNSCP